PPPRSFFLCTAPAPSEIYTLSLHDALPILDDPGVGGPDRGLADPVRVSAQASHRPAAAAARAARRRRGVRSCRDLPRAGLPRVPDRKSTRLNSSHDQISYAVFCLKKKKI